MCILMSRVETPGNVRHMKCTSRAAKFSFPTTPCSFHSPILGWIFFFFNTQNEMRHQPAKLSTKLSRSVQPHETVVTLHLMRHRCVAISTNFPLQTKQRHGKRASSGTRENGAPPQSPRLFHPPLEHSWLGPCAGFGQLTHKRLRFPLTTCRQPPEREPPSQPWPLGLSTPGRSSLCASWLGSGPHRPSVLSTANCTPPCNGRPSTTTSKRLLFPGTGTPQVHVSHKHVRHDSAPCFPADSGGRTLQSEAPPSQSPCPRTCCAVRAKRIEWLATPADALGQRKREMEAALEKPPEQS